MNASLDTRLYSWRTHGGSQAGLIALEVLRQASIPRTIGRDDALRRSADAAERLSAALLAERDQVGVDYAAGDGY